MFPVKWCLAWDKVLISSFHLHQFAYRILLVSERCTHQTQTAPSTYTVKSRLIFNYLMEYSFKSWKIYIPGSHLAQLGGGGVTSDTSFHPNSFLRVFVMLTYLQSIQHGCCWCLRPERINVMSNNSGQQRLGCYSKVVLFTSSGCTELDKDNAARIKARQ